MLEFWGMWSTPSLSLLPGSLWPGVEAPYRILSMGQIELFDIQTLRKQITYEFSEIELFEIKRYDHLTMCKQMTDV